MTYETKLVAAGVWSPTQAQELICGVGGVASGIVAAGTTQAAGTVLPMATMINVSSVPVAGNAVVLPQPGGAAEMVILNGSNFAGVLFPPVGGTINGLAVNTSVALANGKVHAASTPDGLTWFVYQGA